VYSRELPGGKILTLAASGWLYDNTFVLYDFETKSLWYPLQDTDGLTCIGGELAGNKLGELISTQTRWNIWTKSNEETYFLNP
jgi:hypothetical protein